MIDAEIWSCSAIDYIKRSEDRENFINVKGYNKVTWI